MLYVNCISVNKRKKVKFQVKGKNLPFKSVQFSDFKYIPTLCDCYHCLISEHLHHPRKETYTLQQSISGHYILLHFIPQHLLISFLSLWICLFWTLHTNVLVLVAQSCPILCNPMDCGPPVSSVPGILQARILEQGTILQGIEPGSPALQANSLSSQPPRKPQKVKLLVTSVSVTL